MSYPPESFRLKTVEVRPRPPLAERRAVLLRSACNVYRVPEEAVFLDFIHFRGHHAMSDGQWSGMLLGDEAYAGSRNFYAILERARERFGVSWVVPAHRGRGALNLVAHAYLQEGRPVVAPALTDLERFHLGRFGSPLHTVAVWEGPQGLEADLDAWEHLLETHRDPLVYLRPVSEALGYRTWNPDNLQALLALAQEAGAFVLLNASGLFLWAHRVWPAQQALDQVRALAEQARVVVWNAREDGFTHTGALIMGWEEEDYLKFRTYVVVFEGLHTYGGLAGRDMEALARGLDEVAHGEWFTHHLRRLQAWREEAQKAGLPVAGESLWGLRLDAAALSGREMPWAGYELAAGLYVLTGVRAGVLGRDLFLALPLRRHLNEHLDFALQALRMLAEYGRTVPALNPVEGANRSFPEGWQFEPEAPYFPELDGEPLALATTPPYTARMVEVLIRRSREERERAIREAGYNTFLLRSEDVYLDLLTDSGTAAMSSEQWARLMAAPEGMTPNRAYEALQEAVARVLGFPYVIPTHQGRAAEHVLSQTLIRPGQYVINNMYFTTTREHQERAGGIFVDLIVPQAHNPRDPYPFKGDLDVEAVERFIQEHGPGNVAYICLEMNVNMAGGQPVSLRATRRLAEVARRYGVPLIFDATRCAENAYLIQQREPGQQGRPVADILLELMSYADGLTFSAKKDPLLNIGGFIAVRHRDWYERMVGFMRHFEGEAANGGLAPRDVWAMAQGLYEMVNDDHIRARVEQTRYLGRRLHEEGIPIVVPVGGHAVYLDARAFFPHIPQNQFPAQRLAAEIYVESGVRTMERGTVSAGRDPKTGDHRYPKLELVRITIPRRVYTRSHMDVVVEGVVGVWKRRERVKGLRMVYEPPTLRFFTARFEALDDA